MIESKSGCSTSQSLKEDSGLYYIHKFYRKPGDIKHLASKPSLWSLTSIAKAGNSHIDFCKTQCISQVSMTDHLS